MEIIPSVCLALFSRKRFLNGLKLSKNLSPNQIKFLHFENQLKNSNFMKIKNLNVVYGLNISAFHLSYYFFKEISEENLVSGFLSGIFLFKLFCVKKFQFLILGGIINGLANESIFRVSKAYQTFLFPSTENLNK